jgi:membrane-associated phospholipid phosphatase
MAHITIQLCILHSICAHSNVKKMQRNKKKESNLSNAPTKNRLPWNTIPVQSSNPIKIFDYEVTRFLFHNASSIIPQTVTKHNKFLKRVLTGLWKVLFLSASNWAFIVIFPFLFYLMDHIPEAYKKDAPQLVKYYELQTQYFALISLLHPVCIKIFLMCCSVDLLIVSALKRQFKRMAPIKNEWFLPPKNTNTTITYQHTLKRNIASFYSFPSGSASRAMIIAICLLLWLYHILPKDILAQDTNYTILFAIFSIFLWSIAVGLSGIALGRHFAMDVFVGWILGPIQVLFVLWVRNRYNLFPFESV